MYPAKVSVCTLSKYVARIDIRRSIKINKQNYIEGEIYMNNLYKRIKVLTFVFIMLFNTAFGIGVKFESIGSKDTFGSRKSLKLNNLLQVERNNVLAADMPITQSFIWDFNNYSWYKTRSFDSGYHSNYRVGNDEYCLTLNNVKPYTDVSISFKVLEPVSFKLYSKLSKYNKTDEEYGPYLSQSSSYTSMYLMMRDSRNYWCGMVNNVCMIEANYKEDGATLSLNNIGGTTYKVRTADSEYTGSLSTIILGFNFDVTSFSGGNAAYYSAGYYEGLGMVQVNVTYTPLNCSPSLTVNSPTQGRVFSETDNSYSPVISVSDADNNMLSCKYYIDSETTARETKAVSNTLTAQAVSFSALNMDTLTEGSHTMKFEVSDGIAVPAATQSVNFKVDKSAPTLGTTSVTSATNSITIGGSAIDSIAGLDAYPYRYTVSTKTPTSWLTATAYTQSSLTPNTQYTTTFEARDAVGHISSKVQSIYTKAVVPAVTVNNPTSYTLDVAMSDANPSTTPYQIIANSNKYVTPEGTLTTSPVWITPAGKKITVKGLNPSTAYTFQVKAKNGNGVETALSSAVSGTTLIAPPDSPVNIIATATDNSIRISWAAVPTAASYEVEADGTVVSAGTSTVYTHTGLAPLTPHTYRIRGINEGGAGNWSTAIEKSTLPIAPGIPANLTAIPLSTSVTVTWDNVPGATGYDIEVDGTLVNNGPNTNYKHTSLTPGTSHTYRVRSINAGDKSGWSSSATVTTLVESTPVPVNINAVPSKNQITVNWDAVDGATGYEIEVDGVRIDNNTKTSYTQSNLKPGTDHMYRVRAKRSGALSDWSAMIIAATLTDGFGTPTNFEAYAEDTNVSLTWNTVTDAVSYDVEIDGNIISNGTDTFCKHEGIEPDTIHSYRVRAGNGTETSGWSNMFTVTTFTLPTPKNITVTATETSIKTVWEEVYGAASYDLDFDGTIITDISAAAYTCGGLKPGTQHTLSVRAKNDDGTSNWSVPITESTMSNGLDTALISGIARKNSITLLWNQVNSAQTYDIEIDGAAVEGINSTTYQHSSLSPGTQHTYRVRTREGSDTGEWSSMFTAATLAETPAVPTNAAASSTMTSILVTWDEVAAAESYEVEVDGVVVSTGTSHSYLHNNLSPDTAHAYRVRAKNLGGYSEWSELLNKSTVSSVQTYSIDCITGDEFNLMLSAANIQDIVGYSFTVSYNIEDFEVTDLCGLTSRIDTSTGSITGTDIKVTQYEPGTIVFTKTSSVQTYEVWSGVVNSIKFKAKHDGHMTITYSIN